MVGYNRVGRWRCGSEVVGYHSLYGATGLTIGVVAERVVLVSDVLLLFVKCSRTLFLPLQIHVYGKIIRRSMLPRHRVILISEC